MTEKQAEGVAAVEEHGSIRAGAEALGISPKSLRDRIRPVRPDLIGGSGRPVQNSVAALEGGFKLEGRSILAAKPTDIWKARFYALKPGMGYTVEYLGDQWGNSIDTIRAKAKRFGALRYAEDTERPGHYIACVVHPDTPKGK